ncbi:MAG: ATP-dependent Clp protease ATP-binding subunit ClpE, partial [Planctomycetota bacterium]
MRITTSFLIERELSPTGFRYRCRSVVDPNIFCRDMQLSNALQTLAKIIRERLERISGSRDTASLSKWIIDPDWETKSEDLFVWLPDRTLKMRVPFILKPWGSKFLAISPVLPNLGLVIQKRGELNEKASERIPEWIMQNSNWKTNDWGHLLVAKDHWFENIEIEFEPKSPQKLSLLSFFKMMSARDDQRGSQQLQKVGRCLDDELNQSSGIQGRDEEIQRVDSLLASRKCHSVALVGSIGVGKTSIIHEVVRLRRKRREKESRTGRVWAINSQRIVSGMMYLGEWEERWLSILKEIHKMKHILYIEDPVGLLTAGKTRDSKTTAADVLSAFIAIHPIRMLVEMTPEAYGILKYRKRDLADQFLLTSVKPLGQQATLELLIDEAGRFEVQRHKFLHPGVLPLINSATDRFMRAEEYPGKSLRIMEELCRNRSRVLNGSDVMKAIEKRTGLDLKGTSGSIEKIEEVMRSSVIGQEKPLEKILDFVARAKTGLQPQDRPLGVFLCLGPTGVGKTECAKALANAMFQGEQHFLRFDMNEINSPLAAEQLVGSFDQPDGKLTSAVRRMPHAVILLDEIEKAHPNVFDYLLQVIGEGRLTDAVGRSVDFRDAIILMTSNLGASEVSKSIGFEANDSVAADHYRRAAAAFFRPEFINRLDDILIFKQLSREHLEEIATLQINQLVKREGMTRRNVVLRVEHDAKSWLVDRGYDPQLGARVLKREVERSMAQPLANLFASYSGNDTCLINVRRTLEGIQCDLRPLVKRRSRRIEFPEPREMLAKTGQEIKAFEEQVDAIREKYSFEDKLSREAIHYYAIREQLLECKSLRSDLEIAIESKTTKLATRVETNLKHPKERAMRGWESDPYYRDEYNAAQDIREVAEEVDTADFSQADVPALMWLLASEMEFTKVSIDHFNRRDSVILFVRDLLTTPNKAEELAKLESDYLYPHFLESLELGLGYKVTSKYVEKDKIPHKLFLVEGLGAETLLKGWEGIYCSDFHDRLFRLGVIPVTEERREEETWHDFGARMLNEEVLLKRDSDSYQEELVGETNSDWEKLIFGHRLRFQH